MVDKSNLRTIHFLVTDANWIYVGRTAQSATPASVDPVAQFFKRYVTFLEVGPAARNSGPILVKVQELRGATATDMDAIWAGGMSGEVTVGRRGDFDAEKPAIVFQGSSYIRMMASGASAASGFTATVTMQFYDQQG